MSLEDIDIANLKYVGPQHADSFRLRGINSALDLFNYFPRRYINYADISSISKLLPGEVTILAKIKLSSVRRTNRGLSIVSGYAQDSSGKISLSWFNRPYLLKSIKADAWYFIHGELKLSLNKWQIINPIIEIKTNDQTPKILAIYRDYKTLKANYVRRVIQAAIDQTLKIDELLPLPIIKEFKLLPNNEAYFQVHSPTSQANLSRAILRLQFNELMPMILANKLIKLELASDRAWPIPINVPLTKQILAKLNFQLTDNQRRSVWRIYQDLSLSRPMNRLLEGDTGSGKTVVAMLASYVTLAQGHLVMLIAPTEILARQHYKTLKNIAEELAIADKVIFLSSKTKKSIKQSIIKQFKTNPKTACLLIGTHSLLSLDIPLNNLGLLIIDEQHRFGVDQRLLIQKKSKLTPHFLALTATPIPRTLALAILGEMAVSRLSQKPANRLEIITKFVYPSDFLHFIKELEEQLSQGHQIIVVCPNIVASQTFKTRAGNVEAVYLIFQDLFKNYRLAMLHGKLADQEQTAVMTAFVAGQINILIATTIIEVGVDVPNATVMVIYEPERFGLATLHQLRGRVGRSSYQSYCYLVLSDQLPANQRLEVFAKNNDGFRLSEFDLKTRGPGAIYGRLQHGKGNNIMFTLDNPKLTKLANQASDYFIQQAFKLSDYPALAEVVETIKHITYLN